MKPTVHLEPADCVPADAAVRDYDELTDAAMAAVPCLVAEGPSRVDDVTVRDLADGEFLRYGEYYRVRVAR